MVIELVVAAAIGSGIGLSLAAPPGPVNAIIASQAVTRSWRAAFLVGCGAMTADAAFLVLSFLARSAVATFAAAWFPAIAAAGAVVLAYFAWGVARALRRTEPIVRDTGVPTSSYATGLATNLTSPYPLLWWITAGVVLIGQLGPALLVGFFLGILLWISGFPWALRAAHRRFARTYRAVLWFSLTVLVAFALFLGWSAVEALR